MVSPRFAVQAPDIAPAPGGLLDVANIVESTDRVGFGVAYPGLGIGSPAHILPAWCGFDYSEAGLGAGNDQKSFDGFANVIGESFGVYKGIECWLNGEDDYSEVAQAALELGEGYAVERAMQTMVLDQSPMASVGTVASPVKALGLLEQYVATRYGGERVIHMPIQGAIVLRSLQSLIVQSDGSLRTVLGSRVAVGSGYDATNADTWATFHMWATARPTLWRSPVVASEANNLTQNKSDALAERLYAVTLPAAVIGRATVTNPLS